MRGLKSNKIVLVILFTFQYSLYVDGFALLSHEAIIDDSWEQSLKPLLRKKYPDATELQIKNARAYVYGGALIPDIGYSPFGSLQFSHLVHYIRSGDFIIAALEEATNVNEYAFALGLLCHYTADVYGHSLGTNLAVPILFPRLKEKYGDTVSFEQGSIEHSRTEFSFDVLQTAKGNYSPVSQVNFIGFEVSEPVLERAFHKTYGLHLNQVFKSFPLAVNSFRFSVKQLLPELTKDAWKLRNSFIITLNPVADKTSYTRKIKTKIYNQDGLAPKIKSNIITLLIGTIPKVGPFKKIKIKEPLDKVEQIFTRSFERILSSYSLTLKKLENNKAVLANLNYDTGKASRRGDYLLADKSYYSLLKKLKRKHSLKMNGELKAYLLTYYNTPATANHVKPFKQRKTAKMVALLKEQ